MTNRYLSLVSFYQLQSLLEFYSSLFTLVPGDVNEVSLTDAKVKHAVLYSLHCYFRVLCYYEIRRVRNQFHKTDCSNIYALQKSNQGKIEFIFHENFMHSY